MSEPSSKKSRFEVPPLNWKAPATHPDPAPASRSEHAEPVPEQNAVPA